MHRCASGEVDSFLRAGRFRPDETVWPRHGPRRSERDAFGARHGPRRDELDVVRTWHRTNARQGRVGKG